MQQENVLNGSKQNRFHFPNSCVGLASGAVRGVHRDHGHASVAALTAASKVPLHECRYDAPTRHGADYGTIQFTWSSPAPIDSLGPLEMSIKASLQEQGVQEAHIRRINVVAGSAQLTGHVTEGHSTAGAIVADTDAISRVLKDDSRAHGLRKVMEEFKGRKLISFQTQAELFAWILHRSFAAEKRQKLEQLLADFEVVWPDDLTSLIWANLINQARAQGRPAGGQDMWVAAVAVRHGARICTANVKDYDYLAPQVQLMKAENERGPALPIQCFLREHGEQESSWQALAESLHVVRSAEHPSLLLLNVKHRARSSDPGNRVFGCRGLILDEADDYRAVNYPFNSFFNVGEPNARQEMETFDWAAATVYTKLDGTLISMYYYGGAFRVSTRGHPDAASSVFERPSPEQAELSFAALFWRTWEELGYRTPPAQGRWVRRTYCFELLSPISRVVVPVASPRIVLTAARDLDSFEELSCGPIAAEMGWDAVEAERGVSGPEELLQRAAKLSPVVGEGFVVVDPSWRRLKAKSRRYVLAANLPRPNWGWTNEQAANLKVDDAQIMQLVLAGESEEFAAYFPEWAARLLAQQRRLDAFASRVAAMVEEAVGSGGEERPRKEVHGRLAKGEMPAGLLGVLMKALSQGSAGERARPLDKARLVELLSEQKPNKVVHWCAKMSDERGPEALQGPSAGAGEQPRAASPGHEETQQLSGGSDDAAAPRLRLSQTEWSAWLAIACGAVAAGAVLLRCLPTQSATLRLPRLSASGIALLAAPAGGLIAGPRAAQTLLEMRRARGLGVEMRRLEALYEKVYAVDDLARIAILEGFLRRLARTEQREVLVLRGSLLTRQLVKPEVRIARDLDFLACVPWDDQHPVESVLRRIRSVLAEPLPSVDGVWFGKPSGAVIYGETESPGVKVKMEAALYGQHRQPIEIDVAFNDPQDPPPFWLPYEPLPLFCSGAGATRIRLLSARLEQLFAWKLHGLFEHNTVNELGQDVQGHWRMKDLHDLWLLARAMQSPGNDLGVEVRPALVSRAVEVAFAARGQGPHLVARLTCNNFGGSANSQRCWRKFRSAAPCPDELPVQLHALTDGLADFLRPLLQEMLRRRGAGQQQFDGRLSTTSSASAQPSAAAASHVEQAREPASASAPLDATAMVSELPGSWTVFRNSRQAEFSGASFEEVQQLLSGPATSLTFGARSQQFLVTRVRPSSQMRPAFVLLQDAPSFTMRDCRAHVVARRLPAAALPTESASSEGDAPQAEREQAEAPQNAAERRAVEEGKPLLANCLARRLDVLPALQKMVYVTSSRKKFVEAKQCLAEWQQLLLQGPRGLKPPVPCPDSEFWRGPEAAVRSMVRYCFEVLRTPCVVDLTFLEVADPCGGAPELCWSTQMHDFSQVQRFVEARQGRPAALRSFVAYHGGGGPELVFEGTLEGRIGEAAGEAGDDARQGAWMREPSGLETECWEAVFVPDGHTQSLVQLQDSSFCLGVRHVPLLELAHSLRGRDYTSLFEVHVTVKTPAGAAAEVMRDFQRTCAELAQFGSQAVKPVLIENASGEVPRQMMTASYHRGSLADVHLQAFRVSQALVRAGYAVTRTKIEALLSNRGVPVTDQEALRLSPENYFEFHVKLRLPADAPLEPLKALAERHSAHLSRNPNSRGEVQSASGQLLAWQRRFVNMRMYSVGRDTALRRFQACVDELEAAGYAIERRIREYAVYDSNVGLDRGWIDKQ